MNLLRSTATPLGEHSGCSYPACTSQEEILKASAPGLIPQYEKDEQVQLLKDVEFTLKEFPTLVESKVNLAALSNLTKLSTASMDCYTLNASMKLLPIPFLF